MGTENGSLTSAASPTNNHDAEIISIVAVFLTFSLITILLRLMSRRFKHVKLYYDDYLAIAAWVKLSIGVFLDGYLWSNRYLQWPRVRCWQVVRNRAMPNHKFSVSRAEMGSQSNSICRTWPA